MIVQSTKRSKAKKARKTIQKKQYGFPNLLRNKNVIARKNMFWAMDRTQLKVTLNGQAGTSHHLLIIIDLHTNNIVQAKVFYSGTNKKTFTTNALIKAIESALRNNQINDNLMIHSDKGTQFTSKKFVEYVGKHKFLVGSQTAGGQPWENGVVERLIRTFKHQVKHLNVDLPSNVKTTRDLQALVDKRRIKMNNEALYTKNQGLTVIETIKQHDSTDVVEPEILSAREGTMFPEAETVQAIKDFKKQVRISAISKPLSQSEILDKLQITGMTTQHMIDNQSVKMYLLDDKIDKVLDKVTPKKRKKKHSADYARSCAKQLTRTHFSKREA